MMKKLILILVCMSMFSTKQAEADSGSAAAAAAAAVVLTATGVVVASSAAVYYNFLAFELKDWKNPKTESTAQLDRQCDANMELRLLGNHRMNFIFMGLQNTASTSKVLKPGEIKIIFQNGRERIANFPVSAEHVEIKPGWHVLGFIPYPDKNDFKDQNEITVEAPLYDEKNEKVCEFRSKLVRSPQVPALQSTYTQTTVLDFNFEFGSSLIRSKNLNDLGNRGFDFGLWMYGYPGIHHGFYFGFQLDGYGGNQFAQTRQQAGLPTDGGALLGVFYSLGYSFRTFLSRDWMLTYDVGPGGYSFNYKTSSGSNETENNDFFAVGQRIGFDYRFAHADYGFWVGDYFLGLVLTHVWIPSGSIGPSSINGHTTSALLRFKWGI